MSDPVLYEVERVIDQKVSQRWLRSAQFGCSLMRMCVQLIDGRNVYRVRWRGYAPEEDTWELEDSFENRRFIEDFERRKRISFLEAIPIAPCDAMRSLCAMPWARGSRCVASAVCAD